ncbi:MAG TPA: PQQ-dependent sugar dehydrogenase [Gammaproteobacteria bacterium]
MASRAFRAAPRAATSPSVVLAVALVAAAPVVIAQEADIGVAPVVLDAESYRFDTAEQHGIRVDVVVRGLVHPFSLAFLPNGDALISERGGALRLVRAATGAEAALAAEPVAGAPPPSSVRGGGLHEVAVHPDFARNRLVYLTYNETAPSPAGSGPGGGPARVTLKILRGRFDGERLEALEEIYSAGERAGGSGSRLAFAPDGSLYVTTGAPFGSEAQQLDSPYGKVLRLDEDGRPRADNPFTGRADARPEVYSLGHRDQLGLTVHPETGAVLAAEHGPNGGDEVNLILPGRNYGWPTYSFGRNYDGPRVSELPVVEGIEMPLVLWVPSIAPTGLTFYSGRGIPAWSGNLFVGSARRGEIPRTGGLERVVLNERLEELRRESLLTDLRQRIRDVREGPDGLLYVITDEDDGALLRIAPAPLD